MPIGIAGFGVAVNVVESPAQIVEDETLNPSVGVCLTVIADVAVCVHPVAVIL